MGRAPNFIVSMEKPQSGARDLKRYADKRHKPLEVEVGDRQILKKCLAMLIFMCHLVRRSSDKNTSVFVEEPVEIMDREIKKLKRRKIALVKVRWNSKRSPEFTWEHKDQMRIKNPQLFVDQVVEPDS
ncbi:hypothetical protein Tco_0681417 [Tanacetum coccineum]|uniref:Reverse transcriptase domain-containing protein n=1 Tax=Tanacetum coccineum TaxID=301880 RepID=A0ABQ4XN91_9ASTR